MNGIYLLVLGDGDGSSRRRFLAGFGFATPSAFFGFSNVAPATIDGAVVMAAVSFPRFVLGALFHYFGGGGGGNVSPPPPSDAEGVEGGEDDEHDEGKEEAGDETDFCGGHGFH